MQKILNITTQVKYIELKTPFITALRRVENIELVRVSIECEDGSVGIGEAPSTFAITGETIETIVESINKAKIYLTGLSLEEALTELHQLPIGSSAKASLDMAILSLQGFFVLSDRKSVQTDITISLNEAPIMLDDAKKALNKGMDILKVKLGSNIDHAIEVTNLLSKELPQAKLLIDANQAWSLEESLEYINAVKDLRLELIEQPVKAQDLSALQTITNATDIPILADEAAFSLEDVQKIVENNYADMINIKLMKCGGITKAVEILEYAREKKVKCMLGSMLEGPVSINAAESLAMAYNDVIEYVDLDSPLLYKNREDALV